MTVNIEGCVFRVDGLLNTLGECFGLVDVLVKLGMPKHGFASILSKSLFS